MAWTIALPMYNVTPSIRDAYEALFETLVDVLRADGFRDAVELERDAPLPEVWKRPNLLLSQTCGYPYLTQLRDHVRLVATPAYDFPGCAGSDYSSAIVVRAESGLSVLADARGKRAAANDVHSNSGMNVLRHAVAPLARDGRFFSEVIWSGSHRSSLALVRSGQADIAAIDCVTLGYLARQDGASLAGLTVLAYSAPSPGLPFVAGAAVSEALLLAMQQGLQVPSTALADAMAALSIRAFDLRSEDAYARIGVLEAQAQACGYPQLA